MVRAVCRVCGYTFREGDQVVVCPCYPDDPKCQAAVHRDLLRQLHCWDIWKRRQDEFRAKGKGDVCLGMSLGKNKVVGLVRHIRKPENSVILIWIGNLS